MTAVLKSKENISKMDKSGMYDVIYNFPEQIEMAADIGRGLNPGPDYNRDFENIVLCGMGGSAIGGELARSYLYDKVKLPFHICRHYKLPGFVNDRSLVVASSYSGNTEETLEAVKTALERRAKIFCMTTGGELGLLANDKNLLTATLPGGYQPRAALAFSIIPLLYFLAKIKLSPDVDGLIGDLVKGLKTYRKQYAVETDIENNPTKKLAERLYGKIPLIYSGPEITDAIGMRFKGQLCENAKILAFSNQFPELNHNELVGWELVEKHRDNLIVLLLRDSDDHPQISRRMAITKKIIDETGVETVNVYSQGDFPLGRIFSLIQIGDFTSFYLAILNGVDPTPVEPIENLKKKLAEPE
jgi:glucose/mannose-6-phosphate isomerase